MSQESRLRSPEHSESINQRTDRKHLEPEEFNRMSISSRYLLRRDDDQAGLRGLWDPIAGVWFVTEEDKLLRSSEGRRRAISSASA